MKLILIFSLLFGGLHYSSFKKDCLLEFQIAVATADEEGAVDFETCESALDVSMCNREVIRAHNYRVAIAANDYDVCTQVNGG